MQKASSLLCVAKPAAPTSKNKTNGTSEKQKFLAEGQHTGLTEHPQQLLVPGPSCGGPGRGPAPCTRVLLANQPEVWLLGVKFIHKAASLRCLALPRARTHVCGIYKLLEIEATEDPLEIQY